MPLSTASVQAAAPFRLIATTSSKVALSVSVQKRLAKSHAGAVDEDVDALVATLDRGTDPDDGGGIGHVERHGGDRPGRRAVRFGRGNSGVELAGVAPRDHDAATGLRQLDRPSQADAAAAARDPRDLTGEGPASHRSAAAQAIVDCNVLGH
jgi:hypothetical protein